MAETFTGVKLKGELGRFGKTEICDVLGVYPMPDEKVKITLHYKKLFRNAGTSTSLYVFISSGIFLAHSIFIFHLTCQGIMLAITDCHCTCFL